MTKPARIGPGDWLVWQPDKGDDAPEDSAAARYEAKHGAPPELIVEQEETGYLFLGPLYVAPETNVEQRKAWLRSK